MNMEIEGLIAEARMHFQRVLQLFLSTPSHSIFILPSVSVPVNVGWKQYTPRLYVTAELHDMKSQGAWVPKELLKDEIPEAEPTFEYLLEWELSFHCVKSPSFGVVYFSSCPALPHTGGEKLYRELFVWSNFVIVIYRMIKVKWLSQGHIYDTCQAKNFQVSWLHSDVSPTYPIFDSLI